MRIVSGAVLAALISTTALAAPWDSDILPPAPSWKGASEKLVAKPNDPWITPSEKTGLTDSPSYAETRAYLERLVAASNGLLKLEVFGKSPEGRDMLVVIASKDGATLDPNKPVLLAQAGIHPGEIDGKDAGLMLLRDIALRGKDKLLDGVNFVFVPIFSVDGHERAGRFNRPNQRGPVIQGWRHTAQNLNLNRDYGKLDSPEMQAMLGLINRFDPALYMDIHVTDGVDYQYDITYGWEGYLGRSFHRSPAITAWLDKSFLPATEKALKAAGHIPGELIFAKDDRKPKEGLTVDPSGLRFSTGFGDARHTPTVLVENHSLKPYRQRVLGTYVLLEESLRVVARDGAGAKAAMAADRTLRPAEVAVAFEPSDKPVGQRPFLGIQYETYESPASGGTEIRWLGKPDPKPWIETLYAAQPSLKITPPVAYYVPATKPQIIERLRVHGIQMQTLTAPQTVPVDMLRLPAAKVAPRGNEGHVQINAGKAVHETRNVTFPIGSVRVPTDQPLGELAVLLLEPESEESFFAWGFFPEILQRVEYIEGYAIAPLAERMLAADPNLKAEFDAKLAAEPEFAKSQDARLAWFYARTPYYDERHLLYPVGRQVQ
ncbi:M14 family metallopeptidase [Caulobacter sp. NIBR2454]|uniref:M14 family metallopeptidase n=1 Tax=Caulobacter sp. NIBR2454 TaxID=3015996 RepID=UPI0022B650B1|nr:M14 family metallopeptidase [Caulobacter sp. NIBR2454]